MNEIYINLLTEFAEEVGLEPVDLFLQTQQVVIDNIAVDVRLSGADVDGDPPGEDGEEAAPPDVLLCAALGSASPDRLPELAVELLAANHLWAGTGGCVLGLHPEDLRITIAYRAPLDRLDAQGLAYTVDNFVGVAAFWRDYIDARPTSSVAASYPLQAPGMAV